MSKKPIIGGIILAAIIGVVFVGAQINPDNPENEEVVFHVTLADPSQYKCEPGFRCEDHHLHYRVDTYIGEEGAYMFRFVANGDSPKVLSVRISNWHGSMVTTDEPLLFSESFILKGTPHESETSLYYTWDYDGQKKFSISEADIFSSKIAPGCCQIIINPNGDLMGPVSVDLIKLR